MKTPARRRIAFRSVTGVLFSAAIAVFFWGLAHESSTPVILGRYSPSYFLLLVLIASTVAMLGWLLWRPSPALTRAASNAYLFGFASVFVLLITELGLRTINPWGIAFFHYLPYHMQGMVDHPVLGYVHPTSTSYTLGENRVTLNSRGLRDEEIPYDKPPDEKRILVLGDSVAFGWGVSQGETFSDRMEPLLEERTGVKWQVINAGVNGYNSEQEATYFGIEGKRYQPDVVILLYVDNDVDPMIDPNETTWRRYPTWPSSLPAAMDRVRYLSFLSLTVKLFARMKKQENPGDTPAAGYSSRLTNRPGWSRSLAALTDVANYSRIAGIPFLVAKLSDTDPEFFSELDRSGIDAVSLGPAWGRVPAGRRRVSRVDPHPSAEVHAEFAKSLIEALESRRWIKQSPAVQVPTGR